MTVDARHDDLNKVRPPAGQGGLSGLARGLAVTIRETLRDRTPTLDRDAWRYYTAYYQGSFKHLAAAALIASVQSLLLLPIVLLIRQAFDGAIPNGDLWALGLIGAGIVLFRGLNTVATLVLRAYILRITKRAIAVIRRDLVVKLYALSRAFHTTADRDTIHAQVVQDTERVDNLSNALMSSILPALFSSIVLFLVLSFLNWGLVILTIAIVPIVWLATRLTGRLVRRDVFAFQRSFEKFSKGILFVLRHIDLTRIQAHERAEIDRQGRSLDELRQTGERMAMSFAIHNQVQKNVTGLAGIVILIAGGAAIARGDMTLGDFLAFYVAAGLLNGYVDTIIRGLPDIITGNESLITLHRLMRQGPEEPYEGTRPVQSDGHVRLEKVSFSYGDHAILRDVDLEITPGARIAIVGPNGAGKSTILNLIIGFIRPDAGRLMAGNVPYDEIDMRGYRRSVGIVMQHPTFFAGTIHENIAYGWPEATREAVIEAGRYALADEFIAKLPNGYDTEIGEGGVLLSGGECQRLAIARMLVGRPRLLILDEPTNHLDADAIARLMASLGRHPAHPAIVTISHDEKVIRFADTVYRVAQSKLSKQTGAEAPAASAGAA